MIKQHKPGESHRQLVTIVKVETGVPTVIRVSGREYALRPDSQYRGGGGRRSEKMHRV